MITPLFIVNYLVHNFPEYLKVSKTKIRPGRQYLNYLTFYHRCLSYFYKNELDKFGLYNGDY